MQFQALDKSLFRLLVWRLFAPFLLMVCIVSGLAFVAWEGALVQRQRQLAGSIAYAVEVYLDGAGRVLSSLASMAALPSDEYTSAAMRSLWRSYGFFDTVYELDSQGRVVRMAPLETRYLGLDMVRQEFFLEARRTGRMAVSRPFTSVRTGKPTLTMAMPTANGSVMAVELNLDALQTAVDAAGAGAGQVFVTDSAGTLIAHPDFELVEQQTNVANLEVLQEVEREGADGEVLSAHYASNGAFVVGTAVQVQPGGWLVVVETPLGHIVRPIVQALVPAVTGALLLWLYMLWRYRRRVRAIITKPLEDLSRTAGRIANGELQIKADEGRGDEIGALGRAFNTMTRQLRRRLDLEHLASELSREFIASTGEALDKSINSALAEVGLFAEADRAYLFMFSRDGKTFSNTHEWQREGVSPQRDRLQSLPAYDFGWLLQHLYRDEPVMAHTLDDLPPEAELAHFENQSIKSMLIVPISLDTGQRGFLGFDAVREPKRWSDEDVRLLRLVGEMIGNTLARDRVERLLRRELGVSSALAELSKSLITQSTVEDLCHLVARQARELLESPTGFAAYVDAGSGELVCPACVDAGPAPRFAEPEGLWGRAMEERALVMRNELEPGASTMPGSDMAHDRYLAAPSVSDGEVLGVLAVMGADRNYTESDGSLAERLAIIFGLALQRKRYEEELASLNKHLEDIVEERTKNLADKALQLERANRKLTELDLLKTAFLSSVSHELRTPLTSLLGFASIIRRDLEKHFFKQSLEPLQERKAERVRSNLTIMEREGKRLSRLISDFLDISKIEAGRMEWNDAPVHLAPAVDHARESVMGLLKSRRNVRLDVQIEEDLPMLFMDQDRLEQVLINLLHNGLKFTGSGVVRLTARNEGEGRVRISVADSGPGVSDEEKERIFSKFYQAGKKDTLKEKTAGTGLGLAICNQIIQHYQGRIWVEDGPEGGCVFHVSLPVPGVKSQS